MLKLTRKVGESVIINDNIKCTVLDTSRTHLKLGFEYPPTCSVFREEIHKRIQHEKQQKISVSGSCKAQDAKK